MTKPKTSKIVAMIGLIRQKVFETLLKLKTGVVDCLNKNFNRLSPPNKRVNFLILGVIIISICISMIIYSANSVTALSNDQITLPTDIYLKDDFKKGLKKVLRIKTLFDSLRKSSNGIGVYDSLSFARPGLIDSICSLMEDYQIDYSH